LIFLALDFVDVSQGREGWTLVHSVVTAGLIGGLAAGYFSPYWIVRSLRKGNRAAAGPHTYTFADHGLDARSPGTTTSLQWANIVEAYETKEFLLFFVSPAWAVLLPKRVVPETDVPGFKAALQRWLGEKARLLNA